MLLWTHTCVDEHPTSARTAHQAHGLQIIRGILSELLLDVDFASQNEAKVTQ